jgi:Asp-tRNA(Asn)/Glu-tRNA(Gln) amidotransferase A subunit family amidase
VCVLTQGKINTAGYRIAAYLLVRVLVSRPRGSLNDAIAAFITDDGNRASVPGASEATIRRWWKEYQPVAHLAAAFVYHRSLLLASPASMGLPLGLQVIAYAGRDAALFEIATAVHDLLQARA